MPIRRSKNLAAVAELHMRERTNVAAAHEALDRMHKYVMESNSLRRKRIQTTDILRTNMPALNIPIGD